MIDGFEEITKALTAKELMIADHIAHYLRAQKVGAILSNLKLRKHISFNYGVTVSDARMRKVLNYIRVTGLVQCLISNSEGYFIAPTIDAAEGYIKSLNQRISAIGALRDAIKIQAFNWFTEEQSELDFGQAKPDTYNESKRDGTKGANI